MAAEKKTVKEAKAKNKPAHKEAKKAKKPEAKPKPKKTDTAVKKAKEHPEKPAEKTKKAKEAAEIKEEKPKETETKEDLSQSPEQVLPKETSEEPQAAETKKEEPPKKKLKVRKEKPVEKIEHLASKKHSKETEELIAKKKKKPLFFRQEYYKLDRLKDSWRKSRGIDSKKHEGKKGKGETPSIGYKNPAPLRGLHEKGYYPVLVHNTKELEKIDNTKQAAIIASCVGRLKRNEIIKSSNKLKITILNPRKGETQ